MRIGLPTGKTWAFGAMLVCLVAASGIGQEYEFGENTDYWPGGGGGLFDVDSMFLGATFLRDTSSPLEVWYNANDASCLGWLHFMVPGYADSAYALFTNRAVGERVRLDTIFDIPHLDTLFFMYQVDLDAPTREGGDAEATGCDGIKRYTGPNRAPGEGWSGVDRHYTRSKRDATAYGLDLGRRYSIAGWVTENGERTDTVQFAFEDKISGSGSTDYNDIVFKITGIFLISPPDSLGISVENDEVDAGDTAKLSAILFTDKGPIPADSSIYDKVFWEIVPSTREPGDQLTGIQGVNNGFTATKAHRSVQITAKINDPQLTATAQIYVNPGDADRITIEQDDQPDLWTPDDLNNLVISSEKDTANPAYAFLRDRFNNLVEGLNEGNGGKAVNAQWISRNTAVATATGDPGPPVQNFKGVVAAAEPRTTAQVWVVARETVLLDVKDDSVLVDVANWYPTALRFVKPGTDSVITEININTDRQMPLQVQAQQSNDPSKWTVFAVNWSMPSPYNTQVDPAMPAGLVSNWTYSPTAPTAPQTPNLTVTYGVDLQKVTASIPVSVTPAPPNRVEFELLPNQTYVAGQPIRAEAKIYNTDGLVPGSWCYNTTSGNGQAIYQDIMGKGTGKPDPTVASGEGSGVVNERPAETAKIDQCFVGGVDTVTFTLYNAPVRRDSLHQMWIRIPGVDENTGQSRMIEASTDRFWLSPGPVDRVELQYPDGTPAPARDTLTAPTDNLYLQAFGYDQWGNPIGTVSGNWANDGTLHPVNPGPSEIIDYGTENVRNTEQGCLWASAVENPAAADTLCLLIESPPAGYSSALTRDISGNGYLDRIQVRFTKPVDLSSITGDNVTVLWQGTRFPVREIVAANGIAKDSLYYFNLTEVATPEPQTAWTPTITITGHEEVTTATETTQDGAGPVVWKVVKEIQDLDDRSEDIVTVTFSEPLFRVPGTSNRPELVFNAWLKDTSVPGGFVSADTVLAGIEFFLTSEQADQARFQMTNGKDLSPAHYLNIVVDSSTGQSQVHDKCTNCPAQNAPNLNNKKTQVELAGVPLRVTAGPNPFPPAADPLLESDTLQAYLTVEAAKRAYNQGGTAFQVDVPLPSNPRNRNEMRITGFLSVYDIVGNLVYRRDAEGNIVPNEWRQNWEGGKVRQMAFYWSGMTDQDRPAAPGSYRAVVNLTITYIDPYGNVKTEELVEAVALGVRRGSPKQ